MTPANGCAPSVWREAGLETSTITFQEGRHTYASLNLAAGVNIHALSNNMGHSSIRITLDRYGHLLPGSHEAVAAQFDQYLRAEGEQCAHGPRPQPRVCPLRVAHGTHSGIHPPPAPLNPRGDGKSVPRNLS
jgi:hypothetical protein